MPWNPYILRRGNLPSAECCGREHPAAAAERSPTNNLPGDDSLGLIRRVKAFIFAFLALLCAVASAPAQYAAFKSADGILLISQHPDRYFSVDLPGAKIIPLGQKDLSHPAFIICDRPNDQAKQGRFVQVMPVPLAEFKGRPSEGDEALLRKQAGYEINYWHPRDSDVRLTNLENGRTALVWSLTLAKKGRAGSRQTFLSCREKNYILVVSSNVPNDLKIEPIQAYLRRVAASFRSAARPISTPAPTK